MNSGWSARRRWAVAPRPDPGPTCLIERISQCLRPLCTAGSSGDAERQAWRRLVGKNDGSSGGFCPTGAAVARAWYPWCAGEESKFSILRRSRTVTSIIHTSEIYENSSTTCFSLYAFDRLARRTLSQRRPCAARSTSSRFATAAGPSGAERTWSTCSSFFFFFEACFAKTVETPSPQTNVLRFASFCELLRRPLRQNGSGTILLMTSLIYPFACYTFELT